MDARSRIIVLGIAVLAAIFAAYWLVELVAGLIATKS